MQGASGEPGAGEAEWVCRATDAQGSTSALPEGAGGSGDVGALPARAVCGHPGDTKHLIPHFTKKIELLETGTHFKDHRK